MNIYKRISPRSIVRNLKFQRILIISITFVLLFLVASKSIIPQKYNLKEGDIAPVDIKAPRDFKDEASTEIERKKAMEAIQEEYEWDFSVQKRATDNISSYFKTANEIQGSNIDKNEKIKRLEDFLTLSPEDYETTLRMSSDQLKVLSDYLLGEVSKTLSMEIKTSNDKLSEQNELIEKIRKENFPKDIRELATSIIYDVVQINRKKNNEKTNYEREQASRSIQDVIIKKGQNIVRRGEVITEAHITLMKSAGLLEQNYTVDIAIYSGIAILIGLCLAIIGWFLYKFYRDIYDDNSKLLIIAIVVSLNILFTMGVNIISSYLIPAAFTAILLSLMFEPMVSIVISIIPIIVTACITGFKYEVIIFAIFGSIGGVLFSHKANQRNNVLLSGLLAGALNAIVILSFGLINNIKLMQNSIYSSLGIAGGLLSAILAIGILPVFEQLFDIITPIKLLELSNPNQPLLKKMLFEAPGTYHHSILVGNLSEAASEEIGANSLLARVGSYYHDIGKIKRPYFFKENQITNDNPHDKITPKLSTLIITSHVKDGLEMAEKFKLPRLIKDIISQHHGTTLVKYFYVMAMNDGSEVVEEKVFRYDGPKPQTKESAIVMLADSLEAAVRSLNSPTLGDIDNMVNKIVNEKIEDGQLEFADLTLKEIERIKQSFVKVLRGIFHSRIEYPELEGDKGREDSNG